LGSVVTPYFPNFKTCDKGQGPTLKQPVHGKLFSNKDNVLTAVQQDVAQIKCQVIQMMFAVVPITGNEL
jgi:hypothetical protein